MDNEKLFTSKEVEKILKELSFVETRIISYYSRALDIALSTPGANRMECLNQAINEIDGKAEANENS